MSWTHWDIFQKFVSLGLQNRAQSCQEEEKLEWQDESSCYRRTSRERSKQCFIYIVIECSYIDVIYCSPSCTPLLCPSMIFNYSCVFHWRNTFVKCVQKKKIINFDFLYQVNIFYFGHIAFIESCTLNSFFLFSVIFLSPAATRSGDIEMPVSVRVSVRNLVSALTPSNVNGFWSNLYCMLLLRRPWTSSKFSANG